MRAGQQSLSCCLKYWDCISVNGEFGKTHLLQHEIHTESGPPITTRYRPVNPALLPDLQKQIDDMLHHDVIEPSNSPGPSPWLLLRRRTGRSDGVLTTAVLTPSPGGISFLCLTSRTTWHVLQKAPSSAAWMGREHFTCWKYGRKTGLRQPSARRGVCISTSECHSVFAMGQHHTHD